MHLHNIEHPRFLGIWDISPERVIISATDDESGTTLHYYHRRGGPDIIIVVKTLNQMTTN